MPWGPITLLLTLMGMVVLGRRGPTRATWQAVVAVATSLPALVLMSYLLIILLGFADVARRALG